MPVPDAEPERAAKVRQRGCVLALLAVACCSTRSTSPSRATASASPTPAIASSAPAGLAPLVSDPPLVTLDVTGYAPAAISVPVGATAPRPIVVATHGMWDWPDGLCDDWRWIVGNRAWVLCPRGRPLPDKTFRYDSAAALTKEIDAGVRALAAKYPGYVDDEGARLYTGFSLGASFGVAIVTRDPAHYPRAVLTEGGEDGWSDASARAYAKAGGQRVLFACGLRGRLGSAKAAAAMLTKDGVPAHAVLGKLPDAGEFIHWYNGPVADETKAQLEWLFEGDPRWGG
jgi:hypothetical protein